MKQLGIATVLIAVGMVTSHAYATDIEVEKDIEGREASANELYATRIERRQTG